MCDVHDARLDRALVPRAAEAANRLLVAARDRRRARLLQADDVAAEAEAEIARVFSRDLFYVKGNCLEHSQISITFIYLYFFILKQEAKMQFFHVVISPFALTATAHQALLALASKSVHSLNVWPLYLKGKIQGSPLSARHSFEISSMKKIYQILA